MTRRPGRSLALAILFGVGAIASGLAPAFARQATPVATPAASPAASPTAAGTAFEAVDCAALGVPVEEAGGLAVECGFVAVPEAHADPGGRAIRLATSVVRGGGDPATPPLVFLHGGPGGTGVDAGVELALAFPGRDVIAFDQRGAGQSTPTLACPDYSARVLAYLVGGANGPAELDAGVAALARCRDDLTAQGIDLAAYNAEEVAADVDDLRRVFGYEDVDLFGSSNGTFLAQVVMRERPEHLRAVVLASLLPATGGLGKVTGPDRSLTRFFADCAADPACDAAFPDLRGAWQETIAALDADPAVIEVEGADGGTRNATLDAERFVALVFLSVYGQETIDLMPAVLTAARAGNFDYFAGAYGQLAAIGGLGITDGAQFSMDCNDYQNAVPPGDAAGEAPGRLPGVDRVLARILDTYARICGPDADPAVRWPTVNPPGAEPLAPVTSDVPTLILAGEYDPTTPPQNAERVAPTLANATVVEFPDLSHNDTNGNPCAVAVTRSFLDDPTAAPDLGCVAGVGTPFLIPGAEEASPAGDASPIADATPEI